MSCDCGLEPIVVTENAESVVIYPCQATVPVWIMGTGPRKDVKVAPGAIPLPGFKGAPGGECFTYHDGSEYRPFTVLTLDRFDTEQQARIKATIAAREYKKRTGAPTTVSMVVVERRGV